MGLMRNVLLWGSQQAWLRERAMRRPFVRRSVSRFMPGERLEDALRAAKALQGQGIGTILTHLGENLTDPAEADKVTGHYLEVLEAIRAAGLDTQISVKLTQLGLDFDPERCLKNLRALLQRADAASNFVWIDMESSEYVDRTLEQYRRARRQSSRVGVCLQAYLRRSGADLDSLLPLGPAIRLVKGAYKEPREIAFPRKADVDENFFALTERFLSADPLPAGALLAVGTHDPKLIARITGLITRRPAARSQVEFEMLYGIQPRLQQELVRAGRRFRVLISYGEWWFPWYMRRLAERPANVLFVVRNLFAR
jgi:proline dehydrogenase